MCGSSSCKEFYKLRPANKTDHLCQSWQHCHMFMKFRQSTDVYNVVQNPQVILLSEKGAHGVSSRCEKVGMLLPQRSCGSRLTNHMLLITNSTTVASERLPIYGYIVILQNHILQRHVMQEYKACMAFNISRTHQRGVDDSE